MTQRQLIASNTPWEQIAGYSRAVRIGNLICVSGTTASDEQGQTMHRYDPHAQTLYILRKIQQTLEAAGARLDQVVRTRIYITNSADWEAVARAHGEIFQDIRPANTLVVVRALVPNEALVEIEADAIISPNLP